MPEKYDHLRPIPETPCECGTCGLTFRKGPGQRSRRFAKDCPNNAERLRLKACEYSRRQEEKKRAARGSAPPPRGRAASAVPRTSVKFCKDCGGLPHRRPASGCPTCLLPFAQDSYQTQGGMTIVVAPERT